MAPPRGPSLLADLRKEDLLFIFNSTLNGVPKLDKRKDKEEIKAAIRAEVAKEPVCNKHPCTGVCDADAHLWEENDYLPPASGSGHHLQGLGNAHQNDLPPSHTGPHASTTYNDTSKDAGEARERLRRQAEVGSGDRDRSPTVSVSDSADTDDDAVEEAKKEVLRLEEIQRRKASAKKKQKKKELTAPPSQLDQMIQLMKQQQEMHQQQQELHQQQQDRLLAILEKGQGLQPSSSSSVSATASTTLSSVPAKGRVAVQTPRNSLNLAAAGICLPPQKFIDGDMSTVNLADMKYEIKSGASRTKEPRAAFEEFWPHEYVDKLVQPVVVPHKSLSPRLFYSGLITKMFSELDPAIRGSYSENQLHFAMEVSKLALVMPWEEIIAITNSFFCALEQRAINWESWERLDTWLRKATDSLRTRAAFSSSSLVTTGKRSALDTVTAPTDPKKRKGEVCGVPTEWIRAQGICIKWNGVVGCQEASTHKIGKDDVRHVCSTCAKKGKPDVSSHPARSCEEKFF